MKKNIGFLFASLAGAVIAVALFTLVQSGQKENNMTQIQEEIPVSMASHTYSPVIQELPDLTESAEKTVHAVVHIQTEYDRKNEYYDDYFGLREFFEYFNHQAPQGNRPLMGAGSGVIISEDGYIVTNNHVVEDANKVSVTLNDKRSYKATVVGTDPTTDLALIKIEENNLPYIVYGNSDDVRIGEWVLAVGNPFNLTSTVTAGIVSAKARNINILGPDRQLGSAIESFIQTDAAVNRGNSGGALVNTRGELIGINAAIASGTGYYAGYSFAIPVNIVKKVATDLVQYGEIQRAFIGVTIGELNSELAEELGLDEIKGVYVNGVSDPGAAMEAGIESGDVILAIDGHEVNSMSELLGYIGQHRPGDKVEVRVNHNGDIENYDLVLRNRNGNTEIVEKSESTINNRLGIKLEEASRNQLSEYNSNNGVMIVELDPNGIAARKGIREGFLITRIDKRDVRTIEDVNAIVDNAEGGILIEGKYSGGSRVFYGFGL